jgi:hypothetical protein
MVSVLNLSWINRINRFEASLVANECCQPRKLEKASSPPNSPRPSGAFQRAASGQRENSRLMPTVMPNSDPASQYTLLHKLGTGSFGTVYKAYVLGHVLKERC